MNTEDLLKERGKTHGDFTEHAECTQRLLEVMQQYRNWDDLPYIIKEALHMVAHKVGRILTGNPYLKDHYDDSSGYMTLVSQRLIDGKGVNPNYKEEREPITPELTTEEFDKVFGPGTPEDGGHHVRMEIDVDLVATIEKMIERRLRAEIEQRIRYELENRWRHG